MKKHTILLICAVTLLTTLLSSCSKDEQNEALIGTWNPVSTNATVVSSCSDMTIYIENYLEKQYGENLPAIQLYADGRYAENGAVQFTYSTREGILTVTPLDYMSKAGYSAKLTLQDTRTLVLQLTMGDYYFSEPFLKNLGINPAAVRVEKVEVTRVYERVQ